jgi:hypothetical protein
MTKHSWNEIDVETRLVALDEFHAYRAFEEPAGAVESKPVIHVSTTVSSLDQSHMARLAWHGGVLRRLMFGDGVLHGSR